MSAVRRLVLGSLVWLCVLVGVLVFSDVSAFAAAPEAPGLEAVSRRATPAEEVGLRGVLYPNAPGEPGSYEVLYKQSASECQGGSKTSSGIATGNQGEEVNQTLTGLAAGKQYTACLSVTSPGGTTLSAPVTLIAPIAPETPNGLKAEPVAAFGATLHGTLNPVAERKAEPGRYEFVYRQSTSECEGEGQVTTPSTGAAGAQNEAVSAPVAELLPHTTYTFCLRASNEAGETATSAPVSFTTLAAAPKIEETGVTRVTAESATLLAKIDPQGAETSYTFEYATQGGAFVPVPEAAGKGALAEGAVAVPVSVHVQGLRAHAPYQFRVVAVNSVETVTGMSVSFMTQAFGAPFALPDGREWEMVSPQQKEGSLFEPIFEGLIQAAADGNAFEGVTSFEPIEGKAAGTYGFSVPDFFGRGPNGWVSQTITPPHSGAGPVPIGRGQEYHFFSQDLSKGILQPFGPATPLAPDVNQSTPYVRTNYASGIPGELCNANCYLPLVNDANVPLGTPYGAEQGRACGLVQCGPQVVAVSPDLSHVLLHSTVGLTEKSTGGLYEWMGGKLMFVGEGFGELGLPSERLIRHVISDDGSRVFINGSYEGKSGLLMRDMVDGETVQVGPGRFADASSDGSKVFLYNNGELLEYDINAPVGNRVTDLSVALNHGENAGVNGSMIGASDDGSYVYFAAEGVLAAGAASATCSGAAPCMNLYMHYNGVTRFIAGLGAEDFPDWGANGGIRMSARVSPDGRWLEFMSNRDLTGYDTTDAISGHPDEEVYLYDALSNRLICASCNPTGARPVGVEVTGKGRLVDANSVFGESGTWIAANVPALTKFELSRASYQSRYLSDSGRLFFNSNDGLVPQDVNGTQDVYEYEPIGVGDCSRSQTTFSEASDGCVSLISSGESSEESAFLDASETGGDVFFLTSAKLVSRDFDNALDIYDARECGIGGSRCLAREPASPPPCSTGDGCKGAPSPQPAIFGSPASATFSGAGNVSSSAPTVTVTAKGLTVKQRLALALRACHRRTSARGRRLCEHRARARYRAVRSSRTVLRGRGR
jgi:hypothetical protein